MNLIIFDCDGTLVDSQHVIVAAMDQAFRENGLQPLPRAQTLSVVGLSLPGAIFRLLPGREEKLVLAVNDAFKGAFMHLRKDPDHSEPPYPGCLDCLNVLRARTDVVLGLATGKSRRGVDALFERLNLTGHFVTIQTAEGHPSKPHPSMIRTAMADAGVAADRTIMIGDTTYDIDMAVNAGVQAIGVDWGYHETAHLTAAGAAIITTAYDQIIPAIDQLLAENR